jgi:hypothetical protein
MNEVRFYFDFISPYSWLALNEAGAFADKHGVAWEMRPVVYGKLLDGTGLVGPAETDAKRRYTFHDVARRAHRRIPSDRSRRCGRRSSSATSPRSSNCAWRYRTPPGAAGSTSPMSRC